jgi:hypothetical protein
MSSGHGFDIGRRRISPGQEFVDAVLRVIVDDLGYDVGEIRMWLDADELAGHDQRCDHGPILSAAVGTDE